MNLHDRFLFLLVIGLTFTSPLTTLAGQKESEQTNFVFFLVDDLGWADIG